MKRILSLVFLVGSVSLYGMQEQIPTFHFKNKVDIDIALGISMSEPAKKLPVWARIKDKHGKVVKEGSYTPGGKPIVLQPDEAVSLYGLVIDDVSKLSVVRDEYKPHYGAPARIPQWAKNYTFRNKKHKTLYLKYSPGGWLQVQEGKDGKTTEGFPLENNIKANNIMDTKGFNTERTNQWIDIAAFKKVMLQ